MPGVATRTASRSARPAGTNCCTAFPCQAMTRRRSGDGRCLRRRRLAGARGGARRRRAARRQRLPHHAVPQLRHQRPQATSTAAACDNRARFVLEIVQAIRVRGRPRLPSAGEDQRDRLQQRRSRGRGRATRCSEASRSAKMDGGRPAPMRCTSRSAACFPHPLNPPGDFAFETSRDNYDAHAVERHATRSATTCLFRYRLLRPIFRWIWFRMKKGQAGRGRRRSTARAPSSRRSSIPVISTGGWQTGSVVSEPHRARRAMPYRSPAR